MDSTPFKVPCGRCIGCRLERSRQWATRLIHENRFHDESAFITLTYDEQHIPENGSLNKKHFQDFMKRLRRRSGYAKVRFFHAGEYGERFGRPHYHAIIFGRSFLERPQDIETTDRGDVTWTSPDLSELWPAGLNRVGAVTFESCAYVARYVVKKVFGNRASSHYERFSTTTGEVYGIEPEYCTMSRRPGIGAFHFDKYAREIYPGDHIVVRGSKCKPPKYYDKLLEKLDLKAYEILKDQREQALSLKTEDRTSERLHVRETIKLAQMGQLKRRYEIG